MTDTDSGLTDEGSIPNTRTITVSLYRTDGSVMTHGASLETDVTALDKTYDTRGRSMIDTMKSTDQDPKTVEEQGRMAMAVQLIETYLQGAHSNAPEEFQRMFGSEASIIFLGLAAPPC